MNSSCVSFILKGVWSRKRTTIAGFPRKIDIGPIEDGFRNCTNSCCTIHTSNFVGWCILLFEVRILEIWYTYRPPNILYGHHRHREFKALILFPRDPKFKTLLKGPDVTQNTCQYSSGCHDVQVTVCWMQIIKNPDCVDEYNIYYWKKLTENEARVKLYS